MRNTFRNDLGTLFEYTGDIWRRHSLVETKRIEREAISAGDAAVDGLFSGIVAGIAMAAYLVAAGFWLGEMPGEILARFAVESTPDPVRGALLHLAVSGIYGLLFALACQVTTRIWKWAPPLWLVGIVGGLYGLALYFFAQAIILPGASSALHEFSTLHLAVAHIVYGISLGVILYRSLIKKSEM